MAPPSRRPLVSETLKDHVLGLLQDIQWSILIWYRYVKDTWPIFTSLIAIALVTLYLADPAPPKKIVLASGVPGGSYEAMAKQYKQVLARYDVEVEVLPSAGPLANLQRMVDPSAQPRIDVAFTQAGLASEIKGLENLVYLGSVDYEPIFFLLRRDQLPSDRPDFIESLTDKRLGIGAPGTGTEIQFERLLALNNKSLTLSNFVVQSDRKSVDDLLSGRLDGVVLVDGIQSENMQTMLKSTDIALIGPSRVQAYRRLLPYLNVLTIPEGSIDLVANVPERDLPILSTTTALVAQADLHPAVQLLLMKAATEVSGTASFFANQDTFPKFNDSDIARSRVAQEYLVNGSPYFERHLPFWLAELFDRFIFLLMPFLAFVYPMLLALPGYRRKRLDRKIWISYGKLKELELEVSENFDPQMADDYLSRLDDIESNAMRVKIYGSQGSEYFKHRQHIHFVRALLYEHMARESRDNQSSTKSDAVNSLAKHLGHEVRQTETNKTGP